MGGGLCVIARAPGDKFMLYDAGHWTGRSPAEIDLRRAVVKAPPVATRLAAQVSGLYQQSGSVIVAETAVFAVVAVLAKGRGAPPVAGSRSRYAEKLVDAARARLGFVGRSA